MEFGMRSVRGEKTLRSWRIVGVASSGCFENRNLVQRFGELGLSGSKYRILPVEDKRRKRKHATQLEENSSAGSRNVPLGFQEFVETSVVRLEAGRQNVEEILVRRKLS